MNFRFRQIALAGIACLPGIALSADFLEGFMDVFIGRDGFFLAGPTGDSINNNFTTIQNNGFSSYSLESGPVHIGSESNQLLSVRFLIFTDSEGNPLSNYSAENLPSFLALDTTDGTVSGTPTADDAGCYPGIKISAFNGVETVEKIPYIVTVFNGGIDDQGNLTLPPPKLSGNPDTLVAPNEAYAFTPDSRGCSLLYTIENKPDWAEFNPADGTLSGTPATTDIGVYSDIKISATDYTRQSEVNAIAQNSSGLSNFFSVDIQYQPFQGVINRAVET